MHCKASDNHNRILDKKYGRIESMGKVTSRAMRDGTMVGVVAVVTQPAAVHHAQAVGQRCGCVELELTKLLAATCWVHSQ